MQAGRTDRAATTVRKQRTFRSGPYLDGLFRGAERVDLYLQQQVCARIKLARKEAGLTQEDMAALLNVTTRAYQNYETNRVPFRRLSDVARLTRRSEEWILHGDPQPTIEVEALASMVDRLGSIEERLATWFADRDQGGQLVVDGLSSVQRSIDQLAAEVHRLRQGAPRAKRGADG